MNKHLEKSFFFLLLVFCVSCIPIAQENGLLFDQTPLPLTIESRPAPSYIHSVWPDAGTQTSWSEYNGGWHFSSQQDNGIPSTCVRFWIESLLESGDFLSQEEIISRFSLEIDAQVFEEPNNVILSDTFGKDGPEDPETSLPKYRVPPGSPFFVCFTVPLEPGEHTATVIATKTSGEELRYNWSFVLEDSN